MKITAANEVIEVEVSDVDIFRKYFPGYHIEAIDGKEVYDYCNDCNMPLFERDGNAVEAWMRGVCHECYKRELDEEKNRKE